MAEHADVTVGAYKKFIAKTALLHGLPPELDMAQAEETQDGTTLYWQLEQVKYNSDWGDFISGDLMKLADENDEQIGVMVLNFDGDYERYGDPYLFDIYHESYISCPLSKD